MNQPAAREAPPLRGCAPVEYWEGRAQRFAAEGAGLRAVCSYGMPSFHNAAIDACQRAALAPALRVPAGTTVLDVGCGIGRWSRLLSQRGARVTGIDLSPTMVAEAERRTRAAGFDGLCRFQVGDLTRLDLGERFDLVFGVTVLQHILPEDGFRAAVGALARHVSPGGRLVLLEAAPSAAVTRCDTAVFRARRECDYTSAFSEAGLRLVKMTGVDPAPLRTLYLPHYPRLPRPLALAGLFAVTALALPVDLLLSRVLVGASWHKVFVLEAAGPRTAGASSEP